MAHCDICALQHSDEWDCDGEAMDELTWFGYCVVCCERAMVHYKKDTVCILCRHYQKLESGKQR